MARDCERRGKRAGHLMAKVRFVSAQLIAYLKNDLWLNNARHANAMALRMAEGLKAVSGAKLLHPVQANELFVVLPEEAAPSLEMQGFDFFPWPLHKPESGVAIPLVPCYPTAPSNFY